MLNINNINEAIGATQQLEAVNISLTAIDNTPLHALNDASTLIQELSTDVEYTPDAETISLNSGMGEDPHGVMLVEITDNIARFVTNHINFTKNKVKPLIEEVVNKTTEQFNLELENNVNAINIIPVELPVIIHNSDLIDALEKYDGIPFDPTEYKISISDLTEAKVIEVIKSVHSTLGNDFDLLIANLPNDFLTQIVNAVNQSQRFMSLVIDRNYGLEYSIVIYLLMSALIEEPIEGIRMNLNSFNEIANSILRQAVFKINYYNQQKSQDDKDGKLILSYDKNTIRVNKFVYDKFKEEGGVDGIILGNITSDIPRIYLSDINDNRDKYLSNWELQYSMQIHKVNQKVTMIKKSVLRSCLFNSIDSNVDMVYSHLLSTPEADYKQLPEYKQFVDLAFKFLDKLDSEDFNNIWKLVTNLVCDCVFFYTDAKKILLGVEKAKELNPDIQIREALLLSTIEYVTDYVCSQIKVIS